MPSLPNLAALLNPVESESDSPLEIAWERMAESAIGAVGQGVKEVVNISLETTQDVMGLDMKDNFADFKQGRGKVPDVAKSPELMEEERKVNSELNRTREFFAKFTADLQNLQNLPATEVDELAVEAATMGTEERNKLLGHQEGLKREHTNNAYSISTTRKGLIELNNNRDTQQESIQIASPAKRASALNAATEGASGNVSLELDSGPKANLSASGGGAG